MELKHKNERNTLLERALDAWSTGYLLFILSTAAMCLFPCVIQDVNHPMCCSWNAMECMRIRQIMVQNKVVNYEC
jgi:hypothetical protein